MNDVAEGPVNLSIIYARVKQRAIRDREEDWFPLAEEARNEARRVRDQPSLKAVKAFGRAEKRWLRERYRYPPLEPLAPRFDEAIRSKNFFVQHSRVNTHAAGWNPTAGWVYLARSKRRPKQIKVGATTDSPEFRERTLRKRFRDSTLEIVHSVFVKRPAEVEHLVGLELQRYRIKGNALGESIEWYSCQLDVAKRTLAAILERRD